MKPRYKILIGSMCAFGIVSIGVWFAPGPIAGNYQVPQDFADLAVISHNFVQFSGGRILYWLEMDPPPRDAGSYTNTDRGWEWIDSPRNKVEVLIEPHLFYMRLHFPDRGMKSETVYREFRFWKTARVLADPKQSGKREAKRLNYLLEPNRLRASAPGVGFEFRRVVHARTLGFRGGRSGKR